MSEAIELDRLRSWIGKQHSECDTLTPELVKRFRATLAGYTELADSQLPLGIHWCLAAPAMRHDELGGDGHPAKGGFLPPVRLPRRMWASSRLQFHKPAGVGTRIEKTSTIADVVHKKTTAAGPLVFVHVEHTYTDKSTQGEDTLLEERQTIVYRQCSAFKRAAPPEPANPPKSPVKSLRILPDSTLLFRYSAVTFNGHRIHYDHDYATAQEGYPGLVVHGPLLATLLMNLAQTCRPNRRLREFEFRGVAPTFVDQALVLSIEENSVTDHDRADSLMVRNHQGALIMTARAQFADDNER